MEREKMLELSAKFDAFTEQIRKIEEKLKSMYCVKASVPIEPVSMCISYKAPPYHVLTFGKLAHEWRLILEKWFNNECVSSSPLVSASVEYRFLAMAHLDVLLHALEEEEEAQLAAVDERSKMAGDFLKLLERKK